MIERKIHFRMTMNLSVKFEEEIKTIFEHIYFTKHTHFLSVSRDRRSIDDYTHDDDWFVNFKKKL